MDVQINGLMLFSFVLFIWLFIYLFIYLFIIYLVSVASP